MKKWLIGLLILSFLFVITVFIFIPKELVITKILVWPVNQKTSQRILTEPGLLRQFIKDSSSVSFEDSLKFTYQGNNFKFKEKFLEGVEVLITNNKHQLKSYINLLAIGKDSTALEWKTQMKTSKNPFTRITQYVNAKNLKQSMTDILSNLQKYISKNENIYGLNIQKSTVTDSLLVTTISKNETYPTPKEYYNLIEKLKNYIISQGAQEVGYPMLNVTMIDTHHYETRVAIPINKIIADKSPIYFKRMVPGNILIAEVYGGIEKVNEGLMQIQNYASDNDLVAPAISFQSLVTDRLVNSDSTKWVTKLYYPIY